MESVIDPLAGRPQAPLLAATWPAASPVPRTLQIRFTGSGSEYFRIWIVNLLLIIVTLGLYLPFAKARRIRYFYANTWVDSHALGFHGNAWKMFRGFLLLSVLMGAYALAGRFSPLVALLAFLALCMVGPALWRSSMQFRLANTSWRGLRLGFDGGVKQAYLAVAPLCGPLIVLVGLPELARPWSAGPGGPDAANRSVFAQPEIWTLLAPLAVPLFMPWFLTATKRYQHNGYRIAGQRAHLTLSVGQVAGLCLKSALVALVPMLLVFGVGPVLGTAVGMAQKGTVVSPWIPLDMLLGLLWGYLILKVVTIPYFTARMQNLVWNGTRSQAVRFSSTLRARDLFRLTLKNWTLVVLTLGLYRPFAMVHTARLRLEAVQLELSEEVDRWLAAGRGGMQDATGDAAGDALGIDMGL